MPCLLGHTFLRILRAFLAGVSERSHLVVLHDAQPHGVLVDALSNPILPVPYTRVLPEQRPRWHVLYRHPWPLKTWEGP